MTFGLVSEVGIILDTFVGLISKNAIESNRVALMAYLKRLEGETSAEKLPWPTQVQPKEVQFIDTIVMTYGAHADAETSFSRLAAGPAVRLAKNEKKSVQVVADPIVVLRSSVGLQKLFILELYGSGKH